MAQPPNPRVELLRQRVAAWNASHPPSQDIDPQAELAVAAVEGLSGGIGDGGHAFGPNQANDAGGVLTGKLRGLTPEQKNAWAWSPEGIDFQLAGVAGASGGQHGAQAVQSIVRKYERPADPNGEVSRVLSSYGPGAGAAAATPSSPSLAAAAAPGDSRRAFVQQLLASISPTGQLNNQGLLGALQTRQQQPMAIAPSSTSTYTPAAPTTGAGLAELLREGTGGPTHSTGPHIHAAFTDPQLELAAIGYAQQHGLHVGENPYVGDTVDPVHAPNSYHTRTFDGLFSGRKLGQAIDVSGGAPGATDAFYNWLAQRKAGR